LAIYLEGQSHEKVESSQDKPTKFQINASFARKEFLLDKSKA